jgi:hypothetical protein
LVANEGEYHVLLQLLSPAAAAVVDEGKDPVLVLLLSPPATAEVFCCS